MDARCRRASSADAAAVTRNPLEPRESREQRPDAHVVVDHEEMGGIVARVFGGGGCKLMGERPCGQAVLPSGVPPVDHAEQKIRDGLVCAGGSAARAARIRISCGRDRLAESVCPDAVA
jgi:hypothetical protein